jgi:hypothetical protein
LFLSLQYVTDLSPVEVFDAFSSPATKESNFFKIHEFLVGYLKYIIERCTINCFTATVSYVVEKMYGTIMKLEEVLIKKYQERLLALSVSSEETIGLEKWMEYLPWFVKEYENYYRFLQFINGKRFSSSSLLSSPLSAVNNLKLFLECFQSFQKVIATGLEQQQLPIELQSMTSSSIPSLVSEENKTILKKFIELNLSVSFSSQETTEESTSSLMVIREERKEQEEPRNDKDSNRQILSLGNDLLLLLKKLKASNVGAGSNSTGTTKKSEKARSKKRTAQEAVIPVTVANIMNNTEAAANKIPRIESGNPTFAIDANTSSSSLADQSYFAVEQDDETTMV